MEKGVTSRRDFVKRAAYVAPVVLTLSAAPSYAKAGSVKVKPPKEDRRQDEYHRPDSKPRKQRD